MTESAEIEPFDLTSHQAAERLGVHASTVAAWADDGRLPCWRTPGGHRRFRRSDVEAMLRPQPAAPVAS